MHPAIHDEELPLLLVRRTTSDAPGPVESGAEEDYSGRRDYRERRRRTDRLRPGTAGALTGFFAGAAALGVVHLLDPATVGGAVARAAVASEVPADASIPLAYLIAALAGALVGAGFASMTKHLRRSFVALVVWALVFFVSLTMLLLAISSTYGRGLGVSMAPVILLASAAYAVVVSFELPLRRRA
jgi:hypothetical protein